MTRGRTWVVWAQLAWAACSGGATTGAAVEEKPDPLHLPRPAPPPDAALVTPEGAAAPYVLRPIEHAATLTGVVTIASRPARSGGATACSAPAAAPIEVDAAGGVAGALVWIDVAHGRAPSEASVEEIALASCRFAPRVALLTRLGAEVGVRNGDPIRHEIVIEHLGPDGASPPERMAAVPMPLEGGRFTLPIERPGIVRLSCSLHPLEQGWAVAPPHPYHAVSGPGGRFAIGDVPPGRYRVRAWHPPATAGAPLVTETTIELSADATADVVLTLSP